VAQIAHHQFGLATGQLRHPLKRHFATVGQIIQHQHVKTCLKQQQYGMRTNVARAPSHQYGLAHIHSLSEWRKCRGFSALLLRPGIDGKRKNKEALRRNETREEGKEEWMVGRDGFEPSTN